MTGQVCHLVVGPEHHGVVGYALAVHSAGRMDQPLVRVEHLGTDVELPESDLIHVHVTDRLFGSSPQALRQLVRSSVCPVSVTLHDLPQPSDGSSMPDRVDFYRDVVDAASGIVVSSEHEAGLLRTYVAPTAEVEVIPLMMAPPRFPPIHRPPAAPTIGVLGYLYPGKGHIETLHAMDALPAIVGFEALGTPSPGHDHLVDELNTAATLSGRRCEVTGFLDDDTLRERMWGVTVPVAYHRHLSASGSISTWISAGRKPLVPRTRYSKELESRSPGLLTIHDDEPIALREAIIAALDDPATTWIDSSAQPFPSPNKVALMYEDAFRMWSV